MGLVTSVLYYPSKIYPTAELVFRNLTAMHIGDVKKLQSVFLMCVNQDTLVSDYFDFIYSHSVRFRY